jgi:predicted dehydrogenase
LIKWYRTEIKGATWSVGENFRFLDSYAYAAEQLKFLGRIIGFQGRQQGFVEKDWKFNRACTIHYHIHGAWAYMAWTDSLAVTSWRRTPTHQGGYILDGGVHYIATLRTLLAAEPGNELSRVSAFTTQLQPYLPPVDTADVILRTKSGVTGTFQISRGTSLRADEWTVACEEGSVTVRGEEVSISRGGEVGVKIVRNERTGVPPEIRAWGRGILEGRVVMEQEPEAALADLEVVSLLSLFYLRKKGHVC